MAWCNRRSDARRGTRSPRLPLAGKQGGASQNEIGDYALYNTRPLTRPSDLGCRRRLFASRCAFLLARGFPGRLRFGFRLHLKRPAHDAVELRTAHAQFFRHFFAQVSSINILPMPYVQNYDNDGAHRIEDSIISLTYSVNRMFAVRYTDKLLASGRNRISGKFLDPALNLTARFRRNGGLEIFKRGLRERKTIQRCHNVTA